MAWTVGIQVGTVIDVGNHAVEVTDIQFSTVVLLVDGRKTLVITADERTEVVPDVFVFVGEGESALPGRRRLAFEAPKNIKLTRRTLSYV